MRSQIRYLSFLTILVAVTSATSYAQHLSKLKLVKSTGFPEASFQDSLMPKWDKGFLLVHKFKSSPPSIDVYDQRGRIASLRISLPDVAYSQHYSAAIRNAGGETVVSSTLWTQDGKLAATLCFYDRDGNLQRIVRTNPFLARHLAVAEDGSIWGFGVNAETGGEIDTVQRFDSDGQLLGSYLSQSSFGLRGSPAEHGGGRLGRTFVLASRNRVGIYSAPSRQWIEFSIEGQLLGRWTLQAPPNVFPALNFIGFTPEGRLFGWFGAGAAAAIFELDRSSSSWTAVTADVGSYAGIYGADSAGLVLRRRGNGADLRVFHWVQIEGQPAIARVERQTR